MSKQLPEWINGPKCDDVLLVEALFIAWETLQEQVKSGTFYEKWDIDGKTETILNGSAMKAVNAMKRIEELGR